VGLPPSGLFTLDDKAVVTSNSDTPNCMFWMDLRAEPLVLSVPDVDAKRDCGFQRKAKSRQIRSMSYNFCLHPKSW
jgi:hypothetical protein